MRKYIWFIVMVLLVGFSVYNYMAAYKNYTGKSAEEPATVGVVIGKKAPAITLKDIEDKSVTINAAKNNKVYVLNFWASWCPPCRDEMPEINDFYNKYKNKLQFLAINMQESKTKINSFMVQNNYVFPVLLDSDGKAAELFKVRQIPTTIVIDKNGIIKYRRTGQIDLVELEKIIDSAGDKNND
ncbi:TlpA family protein disulfide reductase [Pectinatus sottacetonis]|uniref:TlpA family protein disulfide reductase n=1 Tax=Pectinatus sottacetonis TaxID=1002795 RepID=UPI0018C84948|nr:TlpA disulfide reductase family protein [Pectinatus sottacetonis]